MWQMPLEIFWVVIRIGHEFIVCIGHEFIDMTL